MFYFAFYYYFKHCFLYISLKLHYFQVEFRPSAQALANYLQKSIQFINITFMRKAS